MKVVVAAGGTGGHIYPAVTVAQTVAARAGGADVLFIGDGGGLARRLASRAGFRFEAVASRPLPRRVSWEALKTGAAALRGVARSARLLRGFRPDVALGTGGYASGPVMAAAQLLGVPTVIQEQNAYPGLTSRLLGRFVDAVALGDGAAVPHFRRARRVVVTGNPIRSDIVARSREEGRRAFDLDGAAPTLLLFGGSQGGARLNAAMREAAPKLVRRGVHILWQTGPGDFDETVAALSADRGLPEGRPARAGGGEGRRFGPVFVTPFIEDMASAYAAADLAVCRAGALTLAELTARGLPSVLVPYPFAAEGHQLANARTVADAGGADIVLDDELTGETLRRAVEPLLADGARLGRMAAAARQLGKPDAAAEVAELVEAVADLSRPR